MTSVRRIRIQRSEIGVRRRRGRIQAGGFFLEDWPGAVFRAVVDDDDFMRDAAEVQFEVQVLYGGRDAVLLVACGNDHRQESE